jgi:glycosyltransferase involved in cell wall biosynthesis
MIRTVAQVVRGEGVASAARRSAERIGDALHGAAMRAKGAFAGAADAAILNVSAGGAAARLGGVQAQLRARLHHERRLRTVALLRPGTLELSAPFLHARGIVRFRPAVDLVAPDFERAIMRAMALTGARTIHLEGTDGVPLGSLLRLVESGIGAVLSIHDFSLFCARPHLLELPAQHFCFYSQDLSRCRRCLAETWAMPDDAQAERRALGRRLLTSAAGLLFPSRFLLEEHRRLFSLPDLAGEVVEPGVAAEKREVPIESERPSLAYAGSVKRHKGAHLMPELIDRTGREARWHIFGGGDAGLLRAMRAPNVTVYGYYRQRRLPALLEHHRVGLVVLPSIVPETFGLVLSEAWMAGAAVAAFDLGAPGERIRLHGGGWLAPLERGAAGLAEIVEEWRSGRAAATVPRSAPSAADAAAAHVALYRKLGLL